jgi:hypothetical protein
VNGRDLQQVLDRLAERLGGELPQKVRRELEEHHDDLLRYAVIGDEDNFEDLYRQAASLVRVWLNRGGYGSPPGRMPNKETVPSQLSSYEVERSEVFSEYVARLAANTAEVKRFRDRILDERPLTPAQARALLRSPLAAHNARRWFDARQIPLVGHSYQTKERGKDEEGSYSLVETFGPSKDRHTLKDRRPLETGAWIEPDHKRRAREFDDAKREIGGYKVLPFPGENGETHRTLVRPASVLGRLYGTVQNLLKRYPWFEESAAWFVLTGETPYVAPMTVRGKYRGPLTFGPYPSTGFGYGLVTLTVEPWVSADTVQRVYRDIQRRWLGGDNRPVGEKSRRLFSFVTERVDSVSLQAEEKRRLGKGLVTEWDQECSQDEDRREWFYRGDTRTFWRDYNLARRLITSPEYPGSADGQ